MSIAAGGASAEIGPAWITRKPVHGQRGVPVDCCSWRWSPSRICRMFLTSTTCHRPCPSRAMWTSHSCPLPSRKLVYAASPLRWSITTAPANAAAGICTSCAPFSTSRLTHARAAFAIGWESNASALRPRSWARISLRPLRSETISSPACLTTLSKSTNRAAALPSRASTARLSWKTANDGLAGR